MSKKMMIVKKILAVAIVMVGTLLFSTNTYADSTGGDGGGANGCSDCSYTYTSSRGGWIQIDMDQDTYHMIDLDHKINSSWWAHYDYGDTIKGCKDISDDSTVWILVASIRNRSGTAVGLAGSLQLKKVTSNRGGFDFGKPKDIPDSIGRTNQEALEAFNKHKDEHNAAGRYFTSDSALGWFCGGGESGTDRPTTCAEASNYYASSVLGNTAARVSVANLTNTKNWSDGNNTNKSASTGFNDSGDSVSIYAKPGDSIRFRHNLCYGARAIRDSNGAHVSAGGNNHAPSIPANYFKISASPGNYLFTKNMSKAGGLFGSDKNITSMTARPSEITGYAESNAVVFGSYGFEAYNPGGSKPENSYSCNYFNASSNGPKYQANGYQIPGFKTDVGNCASRSSTARNNAGMIISQSLSFDNIKAWQKYTTNYGGSCNCGTGNAYESTSTHSSFESAKGASPKVWALYHYPACNNKGFICNSYCEDWNKDRYGNKTTCKHSLPKYHSYLYEQPTAGTNTGIYGATNKAYYEVLSTNAGRVTKTASVYIPYNFNTEVKVTSPTSGTTVYQGEPITTKFNWKITKRTNTNVSSSAYATTTPSNAKYQIVEFITNTASNDWRLKADDNSGTSPYDLYKNIAYNGLISQIRTGTDGTNGNGNYNGESTNFTNNGVIPDNEDLVGYKYCVAIGIYPASSHVKGDNNNKVAQPSQRMVTASGITPVQPAARLPRNQASKFGAVQSTPAVMLILL